jgi:hypothetical protein
VDGYGTLKLPNGVTLNNVLRVKTTEVQKRLSGNTYDLAEEKYLWYSQDFRYPVFVIIHLSSGGANGAASVSKSSYVSLAALSAPPASNAGSSEQPVPVAAAPDVEHNIYPNPVVDAANITYKLPYDTKVSIAVYTTTSVCVRKIVTNELQAAGEYSYSYAPLVAGTYFVRFAFGDKTYTEQIVKK